MTRPRARTLIAASCEIVAIGLPRDAFADSGATIGPTPRDRRFEVACPDLDGEPANCRATLSIRTVSGRLLATGRLGRRGASRRVMRLRLTPLGRRIEGRRRSARVVLRGPAMRTTAWTIRF